MGYVATQAYLTAIRHGLRLSDVASPCSPAYQSGREFGRTLSYGQAIVETAAGVITIVGAVVMLPPSAGAAALVGGGVASVPTVAGVVAVDIAALEAGGAMATHGVGVLARNAGNPLPNVSYATGTSSGNGTLPPPKYTARSHQHVGPRHHDPTQYRNKGKFVPGEGGQAFADEVVAKGHLTRQADGRLRYDADLGRIVGTKGETRGRVILDPTTGEVITQFPQK